MAESEGFVPDVAGAILDGTPIDWTAAESNTNETNRPLLEQLRVLATLADLHRCIPPPLTRATPTASEDRGEGLEHWGHLRVLERVGCGAFGEVYRAWDTRLDREVALKLLPAKRAAEGDPASSIIQEGRLLARVRHPNVVTIYGAEEVEKRIGLWMEFVRGRTLKQIIDDGKVFSGAEVVQIGLELCQAVAAVHGAGLLHRDIKAQNVMQAEDGRAVLMDFGTGRELADNSTSDLAGTPLYLAPEILGGREATVQSDIYSLGVLLYHLVTGSYPVRARNLRDVRLAHERNERTSIRTAGARADLSPKLARIIERAIDAKPERRYQNADALAAELGALEPRPTLVRLTYATGVVAFILVIGLAWAVLGRQAGASRTASGLLARFAGWNPLSAPNVNPVERPVIAVLPFKNLSIEPESDYFVDALTDEIIRNLAIVRGLEVRSRTSSFVFKDKPRNLRDIGEQLGANLVVEGSVLQSGNRLRIIAQMVQVASDVPLWSERFDRELKDVFVIQDEISRAIVNKLRLTLGRGQRRYDIDLEAYNLYLRARTLAERRELAGPQEAVELFEQVIARDSAFAPAYAGLANAYAWMAMLPYQGVSFRTAQSIMRPAAVRAIELDPLLAEAHAAMGWVHSREFNWENAEASFRRAIELNPSLTQVYSSYSFSTLRPRGSFDEAEQLMQVARQIDPLSLDVLREMGQLQFITGRHEEAITTLQRVYAAEPEFPFVKGYLGRALTFAGRVAEAIPLLEDPRNTHYAAHAYVRVGRRADAEKLAVTHAGYPQRLTVINAALEDKDRTFAMLERMMVDEPHRVAINLTFPEFAFLRGDPRLAALRKKLNLR